MNDLYQKRFGELDDQLQAALTTAKNKYVELTGRPNFDIDSNTLLEWKVKARSLLAKACGESSEHFKEFVRAQDTGIGGTYLGTLKRLQAIFTAARKDYEGGYFRASRTLVQAEVFDSELEQAKALNYAGYASAAAVVAGIVLETTLRELMDREGISYGKLDKMNADLTKAGVYNSLQQKRITALAGIRNAAAHGDATAFNADDVNAMISDIERFLAHHL